MFWNRFDIVEAYYIFFCDYHEGQNSHMYKRMCKLYNHGFKPRHNLSYETLEENGREIYDELERKELEKIERERYP